MTEFILTDQGKITQDHGDVDIKEIEIGNRVLSAWVFKNRKLLSPGIRNNQLYSKDEIEKAFEATDWHNRHNKELFEDHLDTDTSRLVGFVDEIHMSDGSLTGDLVVYTEDLAKKILFGSKLGVSPKLTGTNEDGAIKNFTFKNFSFTPQPADQTTYLNSKDNVDTNNNEIELKMEEQKELSESIVSEVTEKLDKTINEKLEPILKAIESLTSAKEAEVADKAKEEEEKKKKEEKEMSDESTATLDDMKVLLASILEELKVKKKEEDEDEDKDEGEDKEESSKEEDYPYPEKKKKKEEEDSDISNTKKKKKEEEEKEMEEETESDSEDTKAESETEAETKEEAEDKKPDEGELTKTLDAIEKQVHLLSQKVAESITLDAPRQTQREASGQETIELSAEDLDAKMLEEMLVTEDTKYLKSK